MFLYALSHFTMTHGEVPYCTEITTFTTERIIEVVNWSGWLTTYTYLVFASLFRAITTLLVPLFAPYWMADYGNPARRLQRILHRKMKHHGYVPVLCFDYRFCILSCYQLYPWMCYLFGNSGKWWLCYYNAIIFGYQVAEVPYEYGANFGLIWPPFGPILDSFMLILVVLTWLVILVHMFVRLTPLTISYLGSRFIDLSSFSITFWKRFRSPKIVFSFPRPGRRP